jgi:hypothetical protein
MKFELAKKLNEESVQNRVKSVSSGEKQ